jgi:DNA-binding response OmpR family regulator
MYKILIVEDDSGISKSLKLYLENSNFEVSIHETGEWVHEKIEEVCPDLIILDINLPVKDGISICEEVRESKGTPIIMLTARNSEMDRIKALEIGADDYISKPFSPRELLARINTVIRRLELIQKWSNAQSDEEESDDILKYNNIRLDLTKNIVTKNKIAVSMTKNEFDIFKKILQEDGKVVERETLMTETIWYDQYMFDRTIDTHIKNIRKKIGDKKMILTVRWVGYRLNK